MSATAGPASDPSARSAATFVTRKLRETDAQISAAAARVLANADDEAIHDLRVGIRRLRTLLRMSRGLYGRWHADVARRAYAEVMKSTGDLRDEEVLEETLSGASEDPGFATWLSARKVREKRLRRAVVTRLQRGDLDRARLMLKALLVFPVEPKRDRELGRFARRAVARTRREVERQRDAGPDEAEALHELRIAYKELRYSIDLLAEALPLDDRALLEPAAVFQKRLGEIHDVDVALATIETERGLPEAVRASALEALRAKRARRMAKYLRERDPLTDLAAAGEAPATGTGPVSSGE